jgi:hypothetical protein
MRKGDAQHRQGKLDRRDAVVGGLGDVPDNAPQGAHSVVMWVTIAVPVMRSYRYPYSASDLLRRIDSLFTTPMGLNIAYTYGMYLCSEIVDRRLNREVLTRCHTKSYRWQM